MAKNTKNKQKVRFIVKKKGGFFGKLIAFLLGVVIGSIGIFGGVSAIILYVLNEPLKDAYDKVEQSGVDIPGELLDYINEDYATLTLLQAVTEIGKTVGGVASGANTLGDLAAVSPYLSEQVAGWSDALAGFGVPTTKEELLSLNFSNVPQYLTSKINSISLATLISNFTILVSIFSILASILLYSS